MFSLFAVLLYLSAYIFWRRRHLYKLSWQLPGPIAFPFIGNGAYFLDTKSDCSFIHHFGYKFWVILVISGVSPFMDKVSREYPSPMRMWLGTILVVFVTDAESADFILKSKDCLNKPHQLYKILRDGLNADGLLTINGNFCSILTFLFFCEKFQRTVSFVELYSRKMETASSIDCSND